MKSFAKTSRLSRRQFLARSTTALAAGAALPQILPQGVLAAPGVPGANDKIGVGFIGIGRQASGLLAGAAKLGEAKIVGFADVNLKRAKENAAKYNAFACQNYHQLLERKEVDAIMTATPEHWRILIVLHACQAGKDLYVEKPMSLTIKEGRWMEQAARKYKRIIQAGSQQRSDPLDIAACEFIRGGGLGKITKVIASAYPSPWDHNMPAQPKPEDLDWDMWCGPAPLVPYNESLYVPREKGPIAPGWLSLHPYSGGEVTGWGAHGYDMIQYALGMDNSGPSEIWSEGGKYNPPVYDKPESKKRGDSMCLEPKVFFKYKTATGDVVVEPGKAPNFGAIFHGEKGWLKVDRGRLDSNPEDIFETLMKNKPKVDGHTSNWLKCIKTRQKSTADVEIGHRSASVCHLVNIARWTGRKLQWDPVKEEFIGDADANKYLDRERRKGYTVPDKI
ncbi:MAG: Gfo/Idh/MocA family oxidoreductase [Verrucomicrobiota bacterium]